MSRRYEPNEIDPRVESQQQTQATEGARESDSPDQRGRSSDAVPAEPSRDQGHLSPAQARSAEPRTHYRDQHWTYSLRASEIQTLRELGTFRAVDSEALAEIRYGGNRDRMEQDLRNLIRQSLVTRRGVDG